ncbi:MAG TPA: FAD-dependent oxidoreductase [Candidatus Binatia bacterium]
MKADLVIVGAGLAGLVAGIEARSRNATALVLDKLPPPEEWNAVTQLPGGVGNDTFRAGGGGLARFSARILAEHLEHGLEEMLADHDPMEILINRHRKWGWEAVDTELLRTYFDHIFTDCCWLRDELGLPYAGRSVKGRGIGLFRHLYQVARARGVEMFFDSRAERLLINDAGRVYGVSATRNSEAFDVEGRGVILATGGFQGDREMLATYVDPNLAKGIQTVGSPDNTGDGHRMAQTLGAQFRHLNVCHVRTTDIFFGQGPSRHMLHIYRMGVYFNDRFQRFVDEGTADSDTIANAIARQPGHQAGLVFDEKARLKYPREYESYPRREQVIKVAGTLEELADKMGVSPQGLTRLIATFNASVEDGKASGPNLPKADSAYKIDTPPYYGFYPVRPALNHTLGGLVVNGDCQVLNGDDAPIPGLYAAGTVMNWAFGKSYEMNGVTSYQGSYHAGATSGAGIALVFGRLAGQRALAGSDTRRAA